MSSPVLYREVQKFRQWWIFLILIGSTAPILYGLYQQLVLKQPWGDKPMPDNMLITVAIAVLLVPIWISQVRLITEVKPEGLRVFFFLFWIPRLYPWSELRGFEAVVYRPIAEYGGWGIRWGRGGWAYNVSGNRGVRLHLANGRQFLIGSQKPEELVQAMEAARAGVMA